MSSQELQRVNGGAVVLPSQPATALAVPDDFMPVFSVDQAVARRKAIVNFVQQIMVKDTDFGVIPGTKKDVLLKPGAEKLCVFFGLSPDFHCTAQTEDWTGEQHGGEPFFYYRYRCMLTRNGRIIGDGEGSCNSWETKYRYRNSERICPQCKNGTIIKGKAEYGGGWLCFKNKGGCGAKFKEGDQAIEGQQVGKVPNPDVADVVNTIQKMAQKRALVAATLIATSASEFYTQDVEDGAPSGDYDPAAHQATVDAKMASVPNETRGKYNTPAPQAQPQMPEDERKLRAQMSGKYEALNVFGELKDACMQLLGDEAGEQAYRAVLRAHGVEKSDQFKKLGDARDCAVDLHKRIVALRQRAADTAAEGPIDPDDKDTWIPDVIGSKPEPEVLS